MAEGVRPRRNDGGLPIAIRRPVGADDYSWELVHDYVGGVHSRRHGFGQEPHTEVRMIRVGEPKDMVAEESVPFDERPGRDAEKEARAVERRKLVEECADSIIRGEGPSVRLDIDFDLEREVLNELWARWREVTADHFLLASVEKGDPDAAA